MTDISALTERELYQLHAKLAEAEVLGTITESQITLKKLVDLKLDILELQKHTGSNSELVSELLHEWDKKLGWV